MTSLLLPVHAVRITNTLTPQFPSLDSLYSLSHTPLLYLTYTTEEGRQRDTVYEGIQEITVVRVCGKYNLWPVQ